MEHNYLTPEKAEIIGLLCAEGSHYAYKATFFRDKRRKQKRTQVKEFIDFTNLDVRLLEHFRTLLSKAYDYCPKVTGVPTSLKIHIIKKAVMSDLLNFSDFGCMKWKVPNKIFKSDENTKASFIRGLYEGDGTRLQKVKGDCYFIAFSMKNRKGLDQLRRLLNGLGISTRYWKDYTNDLERLVVYGAEDVIRFKNVIKPKFKEIVLSGALLAEIAEKSASKAE